MDRRRIELLPKACKAPVLPLSPAAQNLPYPIWVRFVRVRHTGVYRVPHAVGRFHPTRTLFKLAGDEGIEPSLRDPKSPALPLCKSPVEIYFRFFLKILLECLTLTVFVPDLVLIVLLCPFLTYDPITILSLNLERVVRIELTHRLWKSFRLPLHHTRKSGGKRRI